jgi:RHS repeat-associated protein
MDDRFAKLSGGMLARSQSYSAGNWLTHHYYHADGNGNITYLVNSSQTLGASYKYNPFGGTISSSGVYAGANRYRFSSKEVNPSNGTYYYGYRWYHSNLQRWLNRDPLEEWDDINLYRFNYNSPLNFIDPDGESGLAIAIPAWAWPKGDPFTCGVAAGTIGFGIGTALCEAFPDKMTKTGEWIGNLICPMIGGIGGRGDARKSPNPEKTDPRTREDGTGKQRRPPPVRSEPAPPPAPDPLRGKFPKEPPGKIMPPKDGVPAPIRSRR